MVYCGKPSKACHACRKRKTRCDFKPEGCGQCARVGRKCPGYRKQLDLLFRDHTDDVIQRSQTLEAKKHLSAIKEQSSTNVKDVLGKTKALIAGNELRALDSLLVYSLQPSVDDCAVCYFVSNYVSALQSPLMGTFTILQELYQAPHVDPVLTTSIKAAGLASYGGYTRDKSLTKAACSEYIRAITQVNLAIQSPNEMTKDSTLLSVILLIQYEMQTGANEMALGNWEKHIQGAAALLVLRGTQQFETLGGRLLFAEVLKFLLTCCLQRRLRIPKQVQNLARSLRRYQESAESGLHILENMIALNELRVDIIELELDPDVAVDRLILLDNGPSWFYDQHPWPWHFESWESDNTSHGFIFKGKYAVYTNVYLASAWNALRATRIYIHNEICRLLQPNLAALSEYYQNVYYESIATGDKMRADILASVPQHLGYIDLIRCRRPSEMSDEKRQALPTHRIRKQAVPEISHYQILLWPVWFVGYDTRSTDAARQYCIRILTRIGHEIGLQHALVLAKIVETHGRARPWLNG